MESKPVLYSTWTSSCAWRVRIVLSFKNIDYITRAIDLDKNEQFTEEFALVNPMKHVPALVIGKFIAQLILTIFIFLWD